MLSNVQGRQLNDDSSHLGLATTLSFQTNYI